MTAFVLWLKRETPNPSGAMAMRESPLVEARSLKSPLQTVESSGQAYGLRKSHPAVVASTTPAKGAVPQVQTPGRIKPTWLMAELLPSEEGQNARTSPAQIMEQLRQSLRNAGARQMGKAVRFGVLNLAELLAMDSRTWAAGQDTPVASENRASSMLLTFYLCYLDRAGDGAGVQALLMAMEQGMEEGDAVRECILVGRSVADLEKEMGMAFAAAGVELQFTRRGGLAFRQ
ncbi:hypothetical protein [Prosthecobacter vanneervenii]|uniref:Uncharacterized protein n=1 Tax=Prosthecobacter vanneervenii TaxID=48466 RepID=A0A7W7YEJ0_9BACT|nr:hypothetical protein [Prosthecobacter vanneervenii]MBB5034726.1 hypothetical protein [Prosthecobacter vanneervenii]